ncbi:MAG: cysteine hydrolase [Chloroflexi bacterium]|nr:cysteine hydrolase [Chloroflexota bacterium]
MKPVVIILDMAKGYGDAASWGHDLVERVRKLKDAAHGAQVPVIHVHSMRRLTDNIPELTREHSTRMLVGTEALEVLPELQPTDQDILIYKRYLSGFSHNDLDYTLRTMACDTVIIAGGSTDNTVLWTSADAFQHHYKVVVLSDCTKVHRAMEATESTIRHESALRIIREVLHSEVLTLDEVLGRYLLTHC